MSTRNAAEILLDAPAGTLPLVVSGPEGDAYRVRSMKMYLVVRKAPEVTAANAKDLKNEQQTVAAHEVWTSNLMVAKHIVRPEGSRFSKWLAGCGCTKCKAKREKERLRKSKKETPGRARRASLARSDGRAGAPGVKKP